MRLTRGRVWALVGIVLVSASAGALLYTSYDYVQHSPNFCQSCHLMQEPFKKWSTSPHHMVTCHECHKQPLSASLHQVWMYLTERPNQVVHHPQLNHKVCAQCHLSQDPQWKLVGETAGHKVHFEKAGIDCLQCHMGGVHEFLRPVDSCLNCHPDKEGGTGKKMAFVHCTECHNFLVKRESLLPNQETCLECHQKIGMGSHRRTKKETSCTECHKPHQWGAH